jgi:hypothetical protein
MAEIIEQQKARPFKFTVTHYRKAGTTHEAFMKWIVEVHLPKAIPLFKKYGVVGYALVSSSLEHIIERFIILTFGFEV